MNAPKPCYQTAAPPQPVISDSASSAQRCYTIEYKVNIFHPGIKQYFPNIPIFRHKKPVIEVLEDRSLDNWKHDDVNVPIFQEHLLKPFP